MLGSPSWPVASPHSRGRAAVRDSRARVPLAGPVALEPWRFDLSAPSPTVPDGLSIATRFLVRDFGPTPPASSLRLGRTPRSSRSLVRAGVSPDMTWGGSPTRTLRLLPRGAPRRPNALSEGTLHRLGFGVNREKARTSSSNRNTSTLDTAISAPGLCFPEEQNAERKHREVHTRESPGFRN